MFANGLHLHLQYFIGNNVFSFGCSFVRGCHAERLLIVVSFVFWVEENKKIGLFL